MSTTTASTTYTSGQIYFSGIASGTDFDTLINKLVEVEQTRVQTYVTWQQSWYDKVTAFQELNTALLSLRTTLKTMDTVDEFLKKSAAVSNTDALSASASGEAENGTYTYSVKQLAQNKIMVTKAGYSSLTSTVNSTGSAQSLVYTYGGTTISNSIPAGATLTDVINIVNTNSSTTGVRASSIYDGQNYYLQIRGLDTGAENTLTISGATTVTGLTASSFVTTQENQDAMFKINNWPLSNSYISRSTNTVTDVVTGLTFNFKSSGAGTIVVAVDTDAVLSNVNLFVTEVNEIRTMIEELTKYDSSSQTAALLNGNYSLQMIDSIMENITASPGLGFNTTSDLYTSLSTLGLTTDADEGSDTFGQIVLDEDVFTAALASDANAVGLLFAGQYVGSTDSGDIAFTSYVSDLTEPGEYDVEYTISNGRIISALIDGHECVYSSNGNTLTGQYGYDEQGMVLYIANLEDGSYNHTVYLRQGKTGELVDELATLTNSSSGPLAILEENYQTIIVNIQDKIDRENDRITTLATHLRSMYANVETVLGNYSNIQTSLESYISQLSSD